MNDGEGSSKKTCNPLNPYTQSIDDLGRYNYKSRVHNNNQWMYNWNVDNTGTNSWETDADYYIPPEYNENVALDDLARMRSNITPRPQIQNEINYKVNKAKEKCTVCPVEVNTPWSEYKSGDKEPEGFNL